MKTNTNTEINTDIEKNTDIETKNEIDSPTGNSQNGNNSDTITISKAEYDKSIQSAEDKVRGKYSKEINELREKVKQLTPVEKTPEQIVLEERIAKLEASEKAVADREKRMNIQESLSTKGIDKKLVDFLKDDVDVDAVSTIIDDIVKSKAKTNGYIPNGHGSDDKVSVENFKKMKYSEKEKLMHESPELYKKLMAAIKK